LDEQHTWLGYWRVRAEGMAGARESWRRDAGRRECVEASRALDDFETRWSSGASPVLRRLVDDDVIELLGGSLAHPFLPLLPDRIARSSIAVGLDDARQRLGRRPTGLWTPECAYEPGVEREYAAAGVRHVVLDGPSLLGAGATTADAWWLGDSDVVTVGRDLDVSYRVWSPRRGYPGDPWYRDFHTFDHEWGFRAARVTRRSVDPVDKLPYEPERAAAIVQRDAEDFVGIVRQRLLDLREQRDGAPGLVVAAFDTELFGHWWHEGPDWLAAVLRALPDAGVRVSTLGESIAEPAGRVYPESGSWGLHKDWHVWTGERVAAMADRQGSLAKETLEILDATHPRTHRSRVHDALVVEALLALSSDWAFMVSHDSAAAYAWDRFHGHDERTRGIIAALARGDIELARERAEATRRLDNAFPGLDARRFLDGEAS
ncbi:MAG: 1,4-alpha-glucan branching protein domain-containing protein, partial [Actinomycetota bacterium]